MVDHVEEMSLESPRKMQDEQDVMSETSGNATIGRKLRRWKPKLFRTEWKVSTWILMVKVTKSGSK